MKVEEIAADAKGADRVGTSLFARIMKIPLTAVCAQKHARTVGRTVGIGRERRFNVGVQIAHARCRKIDVLA